MNLAGKHQQSQVGKHQLGTLELNAWAGGRREAIRIGVHLFDHAQCNRILHGLLRY